MIVFVVIWLGQGRLGFSSNENGTKTFYFDLPVYSHKRGDHSPAAASAGKGSSPLLDGADGRMFLEPLAFRDRGGSGDHSPSLSICNGKMQGKSITANFCDLQKLKIKYFFLNGIRN